MDAVPGLAENGVTITTLDDAVHAGSGWRRFLDRSRRHRRSAAAPGAGCFGAAYEFLFNISHRLRKAGLKRQVKLTYVSAEPFLGPLRHRRAAARRDAARHVLQAEKIDTRSSVALDHVAADAVVLADGTEIPSRYTMVIPPFLGQDVARAASALSPDAKGYLPVRPTYQSEKYDDVYVVGIAAAVAGALADGAAGRHPQDRLPDRGPGTHRRAQHRRADPRRAAWRGEVVRRHPRDLRDGRRAQRRDHPGRQDVAAAQARGADPRARRPTR